MIKTSNKNELLPFFGLITLFILSSTKELSAYFKSHLNDIIFNSPLSAIATDAQFFSNQADICLGIVGLNHPLKDQFVMVNNLLLTIPVKADITL